MNFYVVFTLPNIDVDIHTHNKSYRLEYSHCRYTSANVSIHKQNPYAAYAVCVLVRPVFQSIHLISFDLLLSAMQHRIVSFSVTIQ